MNGQGTTDDFELKEPKNFPPDSTLQQTSDSEKKENKYEKKEAKIPWEEKQKDSKTILVDHVMSLTERDCSAGGDEAFDFAKKDAEDFHFWLSEAPHEYSLAEKEARDADGVATSVKIFRHLAIVFKIILNDEATIKELGGFLGVNPLVGPRLRTRSEENPHFANPMEKLKSELSVVANQFFDLVLDEKTTLFDVPEAPSTETESKEDESGLSVKLRLLAFEYLLQEIASDFKFTLSSARDETGLDEKKRLQEEDSRKLEAFTEGCITHLQIVIKFIKAEQLPPLEARQYLQTLIESDYSNKEILSYEMKGYDWLGNSGMRRSKLFDVFAGIGEAKRRIDQKKELRSQIEHLKSLKDKITEEQKEELKQIVLQEQELTVPEISRHTFVALDDKSERGVSISQAAALTRNPFTFVVAFKKAQEKNMPLVLDTVEDQIRAIELVIQGFAMERIQYKKQFLCACYIREFLEQHLPAIVSKRWKKEKTQDLVNQMMLSYFDELIGGVMLGTGSFKESVINVSAIDRFLREKLTSALSSQRSTLAPCCGLFRDGSTQAFMRALEPDLSALTDNLNRIKRIELTGEEQLNEELQEHLGNNETVTLFSSIGFSQIIGCPPEALRNPIFAHALKSIQSGDINIFAQYVNQQTQDSSVSQQFSRDFGQCFSSERSKSPQSTLEFLVDGLTYYGQRRPTILKRTMSMVCQFRPVIHQEEREMKKYSPNSWDYETLLQKKRALEGALLNLISWGMQRPRLIGERWNDVFEDRARQTLQILDENTHIKQPRRLPSFLPNSPLRKPRTRKQVEKIVVTSSVDPQPQQAQLV